MIWEAYPRVFGPYVLQGCMNTGVWQVAQIKLRISCHVKFIIFPVLQLWYGIFSLPLKG